MVKTESPLTVSVAVLAQLTRYLSSLEIDMNEVLRSCGLAPAVLRCPDEQIPLEAYIAVENETARVSGDRFFGLHMGELLEPGSYSILGYMMMNCATLGDAMQMAERYYRIVGNLMAPTYRLTPGKVRIIMTTPKHAPTFSRHCMEAAFSGQVTMMRKITGCAIDPLEVGFRSEAPESTGEYTRIFNCPVSFCRKHDFITFATRVGRIPVLQPNPELVQYFEGYAKELLLRIEAKDRTTMQVTRVILKRLGDGRLGIRGVAQELSVSVRTLQNRLRDEDRVFSELLEDTRAGMAKRYLRENYTVEHIACLLGYSDASVFRRAFKKWCGSTPREYREAVSGGNEA